MRAAAADDPGEAPRRLHPAGQGEAARLHGGLGAPQAERSGAADGALQGPVPRERRAGGAADRAHVGHVSSCARHRRLPAASRPARTPAAAAARACSDAPVEIRARLLERRRRVDLHQVMRRLERQADGGTPPRGNAPGPRAMARGRGRRARIRRACTATASRSGSGSTASGRPPSARATRRCGPAPPSHQHDVGALGDGDQHPQAERGRIRPEAAAQAGCRPARRTPAIARSDQPGSGRTTTGVEASPSGPAGSGASGGQGPIAIVELAPLDADLDGRLHDHERVSDGRRAEGDRHLRDQPLAVDLHDDVRADRVDQHAAPERDHPACQVSCMPRLSSRTMVSDDAMEPLERLLNLVGLLLESPTPLTFDQIRDTLEAYQGDNIESVKRKFERDKDMLRAYGVPLEMTGTDVWDVEMGYIDPQGSLLPAGDLVHARGDHRAVPGRAERLGGDRGGAGRSQAPLRRRGRPPHRVGRRTAGGGERHGPDAADGRGRAPRATVVACGSAIEPPPAARAIARSTRSASCSAVGIGTWSGTTTGATTIRAFRLSRVTDATRRRRGGVDAARRLPRDRPRRGRPLERRRRPSARVAFGPAAAVLAEASLPGAHRERVRDDGWIDPVGPGGRMPRRSRRSFSATGRRRRSWNRRRCATRSCAGSTAAIGG